MVEVLCRPQFVMDYVWYVEAIVFGTQSVCIGVGI